MGGIDGGWWTFTSEIRYITCPECGGSGKENSRLDCGCFRCGGSGEIRKDDDDDE